MENSQVGEGREGRRKGRTQMRTHKMGQKLNNKLEYVQFLPDALDFFINNILKTKNK